MMTCSKDELGDDPHTNKHPWSPKASISQEAHRPSCQHLRAITKQVNEQAAHVILGRDFNVLDINIQYSSTST